MKLIRFLARTLFRQGGSRDFLLWRMPKNAVCAEIGVYRGDFSARILHVTKPAVLHLIDPWEFVDDPMYRKSWYGGEKGRSQAHLDQIHDEVQGRFQRETDAGIVRIHRCTSLDASAQFPQEYFDWIYIDGNHLYEFVKADLDSFLPKVKPGGFITGDDYGATGWWEGGVTRAVDEFLQMGPCETVCMKSGQYILRKRQGNTTL